MKRGSAMRDWTIGFKQDANWGQGENDGQNDSDKFGAGHRPVQATAGARGAALPLFAP
eukprot:CAMPEP_0113678308 /NCGR_PEP_ID=MMETSP0038_2-20120614/9858_1 /TAXON_ID=2898 /ORGANISM="Cryptomonas paramecium" /LENGTH=57 /DNA_ID=CAMNT_0000595897 /DNA_START=45 /DNA_END=218 /DNA_ORIENTATION=+ /assembly_acc=CAM_ASM_000170